MHNAFMIYVAVALFLSGLIINVAGRGDLVRILNLLVKLAFIIPATIILGQYIKL